MSKHAHEDFLVSSGIHGSNKLLLASSFKHGDSLLESDLTPHPDAGTKIIKSPYTCFLYMDFDYHLNPQNHRMVVGFAIRLGSDSTFMYSATLSTINPAVPAYGFVENKNIQFDDHYHHFHYQREL